MSFLFYYFFWMNEHYAMRKERSQPRYKSVALEKYDRFGKIKSFLESSLVSNYSV